MKSFRTELKLNNKEKTMCEKHAGTGRFAYNWAVALICQCYEYDIYLTAVDLHKTWVATFKKDNKWVSEVSKCSPQQAFRDLETGLKRFWEYKVANKGKKLPLQKLYKRKVLLKVGKGFIIKPEWQGKSIPLTHHLKFPNFKKKNESDGFFLENNTIIQVENNKIKLPKIGWLRTYEKNIPALSSKNVTITKHAGKWFVAYLTERIKVKYKKSIKRVGVDLGIKTLAVLSTGKVFETQKRYKELQKRLARLQRKSARQYDAYKVREEAKKDVKEPDNKEKQKFFIVSKNYNKTKSQLQKLHYKIGCIRKNSLHHLTSHLAKNHSECVIEDLNVSGMMKNHNLAGAIANGAFYEFKRQTTYKCGWYDSKLIIADRFFASSKTCCMCGHKQDMPLKKRVFECEKCPNKMDRDKNASINLENYQEKIADSSAVKACGDAKLQDASLVGVEITEAGSKHQAKTAMSKFV